MTPTHVLFVLIGFGTHAVMGFLVAVSGLVAPLWGVGVLAAAWLAGLVVALRTWRNRMYNPLLVAVAMGVVWIAVISFGDAVLGWTA